MRRPVYRFRKCTAVLWPHSRYLETIFDDGYVAPAFLPEGPVDDPTPGECGYTGPAARWQWLSENQLLHTWLLEGFGRPWSPTLRAQATAGEHLGVPPEYQEHEVRLVLEFQKFINNVGPAPERDNWLIPLDLEIHWPALRLGALGLLRGDP